MLAVADRPLAPSPPSHARGRATRTSRVLHGLVLVCVFLTASAGKVKFGEKEDAPMAMRDFANKKVTVGAAAEPACAIGPLADPKAGTREYGHKRNIARASLMAIKKNVRACNQDEKEPDWAHLRKLRKSKYAFVILAQKGHSSYGTNQIGRLKKSVDFLYKNYNNQFRHDVLIFYTQGKSVEDTFNKEDEKFLQQPDRKELHLIEITGHYWSLPIFINETKLSTYIMPKFSYGYRLMCRWYSHKVFEWTAKMGYTHIARFDDDSVLLSKVNYNLFEFMEQYDIGYAFRVDAFEGCCEVGYRRAVLDAFLKAKPDVKPTFMHSCCTTNNNALTHNMYGYYNNFFATKVSFWLQPSVTQLFNFFDWTGTFFFERDNDLMFQSFAVQIFMNEANVHKFEDWSYQHVTGYPKEDGAGCAYGTMLLGSDEAGSAVAREKVLEWVKGDTHHGATWPVNLLTSDDQPPESLICGDLDEADQFRNLGVFGLLQAATSDFHGPASRARQNKRKLKAGVPIFAKKKPAAKLSSTRDDLPICFSLNDVPAPTFLESEGSELLPGALLKLKTVKEIMQEESLVRPNSRPRFMPDLIGQEEGTHFAADAARALKGKLSLIARPASSGAEQCKRSELLNVTAASCGVGCTIHYLIKPVIHAVLTSKRILTPGSNYADAKGCGDDAGSLSCFFKPFVNCTTVVEDVKQGTTITQDDKKFFASMSYSAWAAAGKDQVSLSKVMPFVFGGWKSTEYFWLVSQVAKFVTTANTRLEAALQLELTKMDFDKHRPVLGLHVRLGDACSDPQFAEKGRLCLPLQSYMPAVMRLAKAVGYKTVFLATDSEDVIKNTTQFPQFKWLYRTMDRTRYNVFRDKKGPPAIEQALWDTQYSTKFVPHVEFDDFMLDTYLLAHTDGLVGKFTSNLDRLAFELMTARATPGGTCVKPFISIDSPWCFDFGVMSGVRVPSALAQERVTPASGRRLQAEGGFGC